MAQRPKDAPGTARGERHHPSARAATALLLAVATVCVGTHAGGAQAAGAARALDALPLYFIAGGPTAGEAARYHVRGSVLDLLFLDRGVRYVTRDPDGRRGAIRLSFIGARRDLRPRGIEPRTAVFSYFRGRPHEWRTGLATFGAISYENVWPGIDLVYRGRGGRLKYSFIVHPGADPTDIRLAYHGAEVTLTAAGSMRVRRRGPSGGFEDGVPVAEQAGRSIDAHFVLLPSATCETGRGHDRTMFTIQVGRYDPTRELVVDPAVLVYCGYLGGIGAESASGIAVDKSGAIYVAGSTNSPNFPKVVGPRLIRGATDAYVAKLDPTGTRLVYCGFIGGTLADEAMDLAIDSAGAAYVCGYSTSDERSFPVANGPFLSHGGGTSDAFVAKVAPTGTRLVYCGFVGGALQDSAMGIDVDAAGHAYVTGGTRSDQRSFPVKVGPGLTYRSQISNWNCFVAKVAIDGKTLDYCGYIAGELTVWAGDIAVSNAGDAFVTGWTTSKTSAFPAVVGPSLRFGGGLEDGFVARVNRSGSGLVYCGYLGGGGSDFLSGIAVDAQNRAYVLGSTTSDEQSLPVRFGPDLTYNGGTDLVLARVAADGSRLDYCGYIGGAGQEPSGPITLLNATPHGVAVDARGYAYVAGGTESDAQTFPVLGGPATRYAGQGDAFVARVSPLAAFSYCGYVGGTDVDTALDVAVDAAGNAFVCGMTKSDQTSFPVKGGYDPTHNGGIDVFLAKVAATEITPSGTPRPGATVALTVWSTADAGLAYQVGTSLGTGPVRLGQGRRLGLSPDPLLGLSVGGGLPGVFQGYAGFLDPTGIAAAQIDFPPLSALVGITVHTAFVTIASSAPLGIASISNSVPLTVVP